MAKQFFYLSGGAFFVVATAVSIWFAATSGSRVAGFQYNQSGVIVLTADGTTYVAASGEWRPFGSIRSGRFGKPRTGQ